MPTSILRNGRSSGRSSPRSDAQEFDQVLKKLETTKQVNKASSSSSASHKREYSSDAGSTCDSRNESAFVDTITKIYDDGRPIEPKLFETRQCFVDRRVGAPSCGTSVDSFIERATSSGSEEQTKQPEDGETKLFGERLPDAIRKLDLRHDIPTPRHKNDVLVEIEVYDCIICCVCIVSYVVYASSLILYAQYFVHLYRL